MFNKRANWKWFFVFSLALLVFFNYWSPPAALRETPSVNGVQIKKKKMVRLPSPAINRSVERPLDKQIYSPPSIVEGAPPLRPSDPTYWKNLSDNRQVPFKNHQGLAVAYGDVVLGKLDNPNINQGFTAAPEIQRWNSPVIPFHIQPDLDHPERIQMALKYLSDHTILKFIPLEDQQSDALVFEKTTEFCLSYVGRIGGLQPIFISDSCEWHHIVHEILHAVGFIHEHSRPDRDSSISIRWNAIPEPFQSQFAFVSPQEAEFDLKYPYDFKSIMHYPSQNLDPQLKVPSLTTLQGQLVPEPKELSPLDIEKLNDLFQ